MLESVASPSQSSDRQRGSIERLPSGSLRVRVYAGVDPLTGKRNYLTELVPLAATPHEAGRAGPPAPRRRRR